MIKDLASLLAPITDESFLTAFLAKRRLHAKSNDPTPAASLLSWATINRLIQSDVLPADRLRVVRANLDVPPAMFRSGGGGTRLRSSTLGSILAQGASLVINRIDELVPPIGRLSDAIERRLSSTVWVNAYLSFGRGSAFRSHWDSHDVLVLQVHGSKRWRGFGAPMASPIEGHGPKEPFPRDALWEDRLDPGDILYLPRGEIHEAALEGARSVHLTIGIAPATGIDLLRSLAEDASANEALRADVTALGGAAALLDQQERLKRHLHDLIESVDLAKFLRSEDEKRKPRALLNLGRIDNLNAETRVSPALRRMIPLFPERESVLEIVIGAEPVRLSPPERRVLALLLARGPSSLGDLAAALGVSRDSGETLEAVTQLANKALVGVDGESSLSGIAEGGPISANQKQLSAPALEDDDGR